MSIHASTTGLRGSTREGTAFPDPKIKLLPMEKWLGNRRTAAPPPAERQPTPSMAEWQEQRRRAAAAPLWRRLIGRVS